MEFRSFGPSGLQISAIGFGCGHTDILMVDDDNELRLQTVGLAIESGINYFDTAAKYASGVSELNLGHTLRTLGVSPYVSTKIVLDFEDLAQPRDSVRRLFEESLDRLGMQSVAGLLLHNRIHRMPEPGGRGAGDAVLSLQQVLDEGGVAQALTELRSEGRVQSVGFTANHSSDPLAIAEVIDSGVFDAMNADFSMLNPSAKERAPKHFALHDYEQVIPHAAKAKMGVVAMRVFAGGELLAHDESDVHVEQLVEAAMTMRTSAVNIAIRYVLGTPGISSAILGFSQPSHVIDAVQAINDGPPTAGDIARLEEIAFS